MKPEDEIMLHIYRNASEAMSLIKMRDFPVGSVVTVNTRLSKYSCTSFTGLGIVSYSDVAENDQIAVLLENGNVWHYPIETCQIANTLRKKEWPTWIRIKLRNRNRLLKQERKKAESEGYPPF